MWLIILLITGTSLVVSEDGGEKESETSRKILGSSVVTSVSVIMDTGNGTKTVFTDAVGRPQSKPSSSSDLASPIELLNPDRYEFYTFDDNGDLVKRLMSLKEIKGIIATGDSDGFDLDPYTSQGFVPEKKVNDIVSNVQNVLKEEMEFHKLPSNAKPVFDTPDVSDSWSMILPAVFGNSGHDIKPEKPIAHVTAETIMIEPNSVNSYSTTPAPQKIDHILSSTIKNRFTTSRKPEPISYTTPRSSTTASTPRSTTTSSKLQASSIRLPQVTTSMPEPKPMINVEIFTNSNSTTRRPIAVVDQFGSDSIPLAKIEPPTTTTKKTITNNLMHYSGVVTPVTVSSKPDNSMKPFITSSVDSTLPTRKPIRISTMTIPYTTTVRPSQVSLKAESVTRPISTFDVVSKGSTLPTTTHKVTSSTPQSTTTHSLSEASKITLQQWLSSTNFRPLVLVTSPQASSSTSSSLVSAIIGSEKPSTQSSHPPPSYGVNSTPAVKDISTSETETTQAISTEQYELTTTENSPQLLTTFTIEDTSNKAETTATTNSDLDKTETTVNNEYISEINTVANKYNTKRKTTSNYYTTTDLPLHDALSTDQKISASELLDQLLLTTNIYEINTELAQKLTSPQFIAQYETKTTGLSQDTQPTETMQAETTTNRLYIGTDKEEPATDQTLLQSIEQLLSQAVDGVQETIISTGDNKKVQELLAGSFNTNMSDNIQETATVASELVASNKENDEATRTEENNTEEFISSSSSNTLSQSVSTLLSQFYKTSQPSLTTLPAVTTEKYPVRTTVISNRKTDEEGTTNKEAGVNNFTTQKTIESPSTTKLNAENEKDISKITIQKQDDMLKDTALNDTDDIPHIINITIIRSEDKVNQSKPPKTDFRLEEYELDTKKPLTTLGYDKENITSQSIEELFTTEESSTIQQPTTTNANISYFDFTTQLVNERIQTTVNEDITEANAATTEFLELLKTTSEKTATSFIGGNIEFTTLPPIKIKDYLSVDTTSTQINEDSTVTTIENFNTGTASSTSTTQTLKQSTPVPVPQKTSKRPDPKPSIVITINENSSYVTENGKPIYPKSENTNSTQKHSEESTKINDSTENTWTLVSTVAPHSTKEDTVGNNSPVIPEFPPEVIDQPVSVDLVPKPMQGFGLEDSTAQLDTDVYQFAQLCNELAFGFWKIITGSVSSVRSVFVSPFAATSLLAMVFLGARGATSNEMNEILRLDDMVTFNPHLIFKNISESIGSDPDSGIATSVIIRELFSDRSKGKLLDFYKNRARAFYDGYVEEVGFREIGDVIRRRSNLLVKKYTNGKMTEFLRDSSITARPPLAGISLNIFQTDCTQGSTEGRNGEMYFVVLPSIRQRRLVPIPAVVFKSGFLAGYEPSLDATAVALGTKDHVVSTIFVVPGQQGIAAPGDGLARLEKRLAESSFKKGAWSRLLRSLIPRPGLEVQLPRFSHRSVINATVTLKKMGLHELFDADKADLRGLNGVANELHLSDMLQVNSFATCGENRITDTHHSEIYPANVHRSRAARFLIKQNAEIDILEEPRDYQRSFHDPSYDPENLSLPLSLRPRQARIPEVPLLKFDRPFLYFVRHNPTGLILHMGRFNPRLLP